MAVRPWCSGAVVPAAVRLSGHLAHAILPHPPLLPENRLRRLRVLVLLEKVPRNWLLRPLARRVLLRLLMLWTIILVLLVLWAVGLASAYTMGGLLHLLLVVAVIVLIVQLVQGRRVV